MFNGTAFVPIQSRFFIFNSSNCLLIVVTNSNSTTKNTHTRDKKFHAIWIGENLIKFCCLFSLSWIFFSSVCSKTKCRINNKSLMISHLLQTLISSEILHIWFTNKFHLLFVRFLFVCYFFTLLLIHCCCFCAALVTFCLYITLNRWRTMFAERDEHYLPTERTNWDTHRWDGEEIFFLAKIHSNRECRMHQMPCTI